MARVKLWILIYLCKDRNGGIDGIGDDEEHSLRAVFGTSFSDALRYVKVSV